MAANIIENVSIFGIFCVIIIICANLQNTYAETRTERFKTWADSLQEDILRELNKSTEIDSLREGYKYSGFETSELIGTELLQFVATKWKEIFALKIKAVTSIVNRLEELYKDYDYVADITNVSYTSSKNLTQDNVQVAYSEKFLSNVSLYSSSVHIPTDVYEYDAVILNGIKASNPIDEIFIENAKNDSDLIWQYFGNAKGYYRSYPAKQWVTPTEFDEYDVRRRGWYIQASSSPKNVMILIDVSGSTHGLVLEIMKVSVSQALDTLSNDDYVMIGIFSENCSTLGCFNTFVQANLRNKERLKGFLSTLKANQRANLTKALEYAIDEFDIFEDIEKQGQKNNNQGTNCIRAVMIFTDGGRERAKDLLEKINRQEDGTPKVRIFVYNVGTDAMVPNDGVKEMACQNHGFFSEIRAFGAVRLRTLDYVPVLSRPMVLSSKKIFQWSDIYLDILGLGMMTTLTLPVYNIKIIDGKRNEELLGVVGTDITTKTMSDLVPQRKIGPEGYAFGINTNGYILLHPRLKAQLGYLTQPPNVDFLEVEFEDENKIKLRRNMIDGKTGNVTFNTMIMSSNERYVEEVLMTYSYTVIENTTFSVAIAQPEFDLVQFRPILTEDEIQDGLEKLNPENQMDNLVLIAPWLICKYLEETKLSSQAIYKHLFKYNESNCDIPNFFKLLGDSIITREWVNNITTSEYYNQSMMGVLSVFVATQAGMTRYIPKDFLKNEDEKQDPWEQMYYYRPLYKADTYIFSVPYNDGGHNNDVNNIITVSRSIHLSVNNAPTVVGAILNADKFDLFWLNPSYDYQNYSLCYDDTTMDHCYLLDDGGFIIATSLEDKSVIGRFFGEVDGIIMNDLLNESIYNKIESYDYQAACPRTVEVRSAGLKSNFIPTITDIINFNWWLTSAFWTFLQHTMFDLFFGMSDHVVYAANAERQVNDSCIKLLTQFYYGENLQLKKGMVENRSWMTSRLNETNLILLSVNTRCMENECSEFVVHQAPQDTGIEDIDPCNDAETPRYRKRPAGTCFDFNVDESLNCTNSGNRLLSNGGFITLTILILATNIQYLPL